MLRFFAERGGDPDRAGQAAAARPDAVARRAARASRPGPARAGTAGRPGWHIECATIALDTIGMGFDVQGGGSDLVFPHHEYSAVHAEALTATKPFARAYVHAAMIGLDGEKMSKSRGQPGVRLQAARRRRRPDGDPAGAAVGALPHRPRLDGGPADAPPRSGWPPGAGRSPCTPVRRPAPLLPGCASGSPTTWTARARSPLVDAWAARDPRRRTPDRGGRGARGSSATPSTRCSAWRWRLRMTRRAVPVHRPGRPRAGGGGARARGDPRGRHARARAARGRRTRCGRRSSATATGSCTPRRSAGSSTRRRSS